MMNELPMMLLKMSGITLLYIGVTALLFVFWQKKGKNTRLKLLFGLIFGALAVAHNHLRIDYTLMVANVADVGLIWPLAAGLFFSPLSGIVSGLIGGAERILAGEWLDNGDFTRYACGFSMFLAGLLTAALWRWVYHGKKPTAVHALMVGAVMQVFHMYAILVTNRSDLMIAYEYVRICSIPMISFSAVGLAGCSLAVHRLSHGFQGFRIFDARERTPLFVQFQRQLLVVIVLLFSVSLLVGYNVQVRIAIDNAKVYMQIRKLDLLDTYNKNGNDIAAFGTGVDVAVQDSNYASGLVDTEKRIILWNEIGEEGTALLEEDVRLIVDNADKDVFFTTFSFLPYMETMNLTTRVDDHYYLLTLYAASAVRYGGDIQMHETIFSNILIFCILYMLISIMVENMVVRNLSEVNRSLNRIAGGQLEDSVNVRASLEFSELSDDINQTVGVLRGYIDEAGRRMEKDLKLAADIQDAALPKNFTFNRGDFEIFALMDPAKEVGGDFYDFFFIDQNTLVLVIADVSGKSIPAAMFMMRSKTAIKNFARSGHDPAKLLEHVNTALCEGNDADMFVTVWLGIIDLSTGCMRCANAGHEYPLLGRMGHDYELIKDKHSLALAVMDGIPISGYELQLDPGDRIFVYTDGVPEAINEKEEPYGVKRLVEKLNTLKNASEEETLKSVLEDTEAFSGTAEQFDDITMLGFTYKGKAEEKS